MSVAIAFGKFATAALPFADVVTLPLPVTVKVPLFTIAQPSFTVISLPFKLSVMVLSAGMVTFAVTSFSKVTVALLAAATASARVL